MAEWIPLDQLKNWPKSAVQKLNQLGITTADQVVSRAAVPGGLSALSQHLKSVMTEEEVQRAVDAARAHLPADVLGQLEAHVDTSRMGLGALPYPPNPPKHDVQPEADRPAPGILDLPNDRSS